MAQTGGLQMNGTATALANNGSFSPNTTFNTNAPQVIPGQQQVNYPAPVGSAQNSDPTAKVTPIISANQAADHLGTVTTNVNNIANGVSTQSQNNAQNQAANSQNNANNGTQTDTGASTQNPPPADNSDLTGALNDATTALNAGNGITPPDQNALNTTESNLSTEASQINDSLTKVNSDLDTAYTQFNSQLGQIQNGTFPLNPAQQGLVDQTKSAMNSLIQSAQTQAQLYQQAAQTFGAVHGLAEFNPGAVLQGVNAAVARGAAAVADAEFKGVQALAQVQKDIQTEDTTNITDSYDALTKELDSKQTELNKMATDVQTEAKNAQDEFDKQMTQYTTQVQNAISNAFKSVTLSDTEKKNVFDEAMQSKTFDEKQKQDMVDDYYKGVTASHEAATLADQQAQITGIYTDPTTGKQSLTLDAQKLLGDNSAAISEGLTPTATINPKTGQPFTYVNGSNLTPEAAAAAQAQGYSVVSKENMPTMTMITNTQNELGNLISSLQSAGVMDTNGKFLASGITGRAGGLLGMTWGAGNAADSVANFGTYLTSLLKGTGQSTDFNKLPGTGELAATLQDNIPAKGDSQSELETKLTNITTALSSAQNGLLVTGSQNSQPTSINYNGKVYSVDSQGNLTQQ